MRSGPAPEVGALMGRKPTVRIGDVFDRLTVIDFSYSDGKKRYYKCRCFCGKQIVVKGTSLKLTKYSTRSCGCAAKDTNRVRLDEAIKNSDRAEVLFRHGYSAMLHRHKKRWTSQAIAFVEYKEMASKPCVYCAHPGSNTIKDRDGRGGFITDAVIKHNGIDRINSEYGYTIDNTQPVCGFCNTAKLDKSEIYFFQWVKRVYEHLGLNHLDKSESMEYSGPNSNKKHRT